jgi:hypothetical protein
MVSIDAMSLMSSPRRRAASAYTVLPCRRVMKNGGSSLTNATNRTVNAGSMLAKRREISRRAETPLALSLAPGLPETVS